jgi:TonB-dependent SusC/RagA subfamily outer membrane receptor
MAKLFYFFRNRKRFLYFMFFSLFLGSNISLASAQGSITIQGKVIDERSSEAIIGANIVVKNAKTNAGTTTDINGEFNLQISSLPATLVISYIGYRPEEIDIYEKPTKPITISLSENILDEVVVVGYGTQRRANLTGSVSTVNSDELLKVPSSNVSGLLTGKAAGLFIKQAQGVPGAEISTISIRGFDAPLILVDGIETSWDRLDPNEIEQISILKDASTAIYGARAGNGVILITTKRGAEGKTRFTYNGNVTWQSPTVVPQFVSSA